MTGMAAATIMLDGRSASCAPCRRRTRNAVERFRRQTAALGGNGRTGVPYGEYLRMLDPDDRSQLAIMHAAASLFRGAGYTAFDGTVPADTMQSAVAAPYAHTTAPFRRLVDRFSLLVCEALNSAKPCRGWIRATLPPSPPIMAASDTSPRGWNTAPSTS